MKKLIFMFQDANIIEVGWVERSESQHINRLLGFYNLTLNFFPPSRARSEI